MQSSRDADKDTPAATPLSMQLRTRTRAIHRQAERAGIIRAISTGAVSRYTYACYLRNLYPVYAALEARLRHAPLAGSGSPLTAPGLARQAALRQDLEALAGASWVSALPAFEASEAYRHDVQDAAPAELVAHAYVRYLADLNGGGILRDALMRHLHLGDTELAFHAFPALGDTARFIERFRVAIDELVPGRDQRLALSAAERAFRLNIALAEAVMQT
jgi:heme oxygenase